MYADRPTKLEFSGRAANGDPFPMLISLSLVIVEVKEKRDWGLGSCLDQPLRVGQ